MSAAGSLGGWARATLHGATVQRHDHGASCTGPRRVSYEAVAPIQAEEESHPVGRRAACNAVFTISVVSAFLR